jgi:hypothetical protein
MQLEEFIASRLAQIARGVKRAQEETIDDYAPWVSPVGRKMPPLPDMALFPMGNNEEVYLQNVGFDVAVTASDKVEGDTRGGVRVLLGWASPVALPSKTRTRPHRAYSSTSLLCSLACASSRAKADSTPTTSASRRTWTA